MRPRPPQEREPARRAPWLVAGGAGALWLAARLAPAAWVDGPWAQGLLPLASRAARPLLEALPASASALSVASLLLALAALALRRPRAWLVWALALLVGAGATFELAWGVAYRRTPLERHLGLPERAPDLLDGSRAADLVLAVAAGAAPIEPAALDLDAPWPAGSWAAATACVAAADALVVGRAAPLPLPRVVRRLPAGTLLAGGFGGVVGPWWREPHVDGGLPPAAARATALHELVHAAGWAREAETDALAVLAGLACPDREVRFAAAVHALALLRAEVGRLGPAPPEAAPGTTAEALLERLATAPDAVRHAQAAAREAAARHARPALQRAAGAGYDAYLRAQGLEAGIADYGRAGTVVVAALAACARGATGLPCPHPPTP